ncbi:unnamed protein product, partial [Pylaiella littoralis]
SGASVVGEEVEAQRGGQPSESVVDNTLPSSPAAGEEAEERGEVKQAPPRAPAVDTVHAAAAAPDSPNSTLTRGGDNTSSTPTAEPVTASRSA